MARFSARFSVGRVAAMVTVLGLTALPFVSCSAGPMKVDFRGHEILRNAAPTFEGKKAKDGDSLFSASDAWLHWVYIAATVAAVVGLAVARRTAIAVAVAGLLLTVVFLVGFDARIERELTSGKSAKKGPKDGVGMTMEVGAYLTLLGFGVSGLSGIFDERRRRRPTPPQSTAG